MDYHIHSNSQYADKGLSVKQKFATIPALSLILFFAFFLLLDQGLSLLGFPATETIQVVHPPNFREVRKNIEFNYLFSTNSQGLRYYEIPLSKPHNEYRVLVLGDSFVEGPGVEIEETFSALLEEKFSHDSQTVRFVNMGLTAQGPTQYARALLQVGLRYNPDAILLCIYANDVSDSPEQTGNDLLGPPKPEGWRKIPYKLWPRIYILLDRFFSEQEEQPSRGWLKYMVDRARQSGISEDRISQWKTRIPAEWISAVEREEMNHALLAWGLMKPDYWVESLDIATPRATRKWQTMQEALQKVLATTQERNLRLGIAFIPFNFQYDHRTYQRKDHEPWQLSGMKIRKEWLNNKTELERKLELWAQRNSVPFLNLTPIFREESARSENLNFPIDGHWTANGHRVAADAIEKWLKTQSFFPVPEKMRL